MTPAKDGKRRLISRPTPLQLSGEVVVRQELLAVDGDEHVAILKDSERTRRVRNLRHRERRRHHLAKGLDGRHRCRFLRDHPHLLAFFGFTLLLLGSAEDVLLGPDGAVLGEVRTDHLAQGEGA